MAEQVDKKITQLKPKVEEKVSLAIQEVIDAQPHLMALSALKDCTYKTMYWSGKLIRKIEEELKDFVRARDALIRQFGAPKEKDPVNYEVKPENLEAFKKELDVLLNEPIEIPGMSLPLFLPTEDAKKLSIGDLAVLGDKFFKIEEPPKE